MQNSLSTNCLFLLCFRLWSIVSITVLSQNGLDTFVYFFVYFHFRFTVSIPVLLQNGLDAFAYFSVFPFLIHRHHYRIITERARYLR